MGEVSGKIPGETAGARAVAIAGLLAELGCTTVTLRGAGTGGETGEGAERTLAARVTDLPGELARLGRGELVGLPGEIRVVFAADGASWWGSEALGAAARQILKIDLK